MLESNLYLSSIYFANRIKALLLVHKRDGYLGGGKGIGKKGWRRIWVSNGQKGARP